MLAWDSSPAGATSETAASRSYGATHEWLHVRLRAALHAEPARAHRGVLLPPRRRRAPAPALRRVRALAAPAAGPLWRLRIRPLDVATGLGAWLHLHLDDHAPGPRPAVRRRPAVCRGGRRAGGGPATRHRGVRHRAGRASPRASGGASGRSGVGRDRPALLRATRLSRNTSRGSCARSRPWALARSRLRT